MGLNERENTEMHKIFRSQYGFLRTTKDGGVFSVDEKTAQCLVEKGLVEYTNLGTTQFIRLTKNGILFVNEEKNESV